MLPGFVEVSRFSWETESCALWRQSARGLQPRAADEGMKMRDGRVRGGNESATVRAVSLLRNRHDADIVRYIPGSTTTALLSSNPEVLQPGSMGDARRRARGEKRTPGDRGEKRARGGTTSWFAGKKGTGRRGGIIGAEVSRACRSGPRASSVSSPGVEELLAACLLPSFAIVSFLSVLVPLQFRLIDMYTYNI